MPVTIFMEMMCLASIFAKEKEADVYYGEANFVKENKRPHWYPF